MVPLSGYDPLHSVRTDGNSWTCWDPSWGPGEGSAAEKQTDGGGQALWSLGGRARTTSTPVRLPSFQIGERSVLITGCDSGFGFALAKHLHEKGFIIYAGCLLKVRTWRRLPGRGWCSARVVLSWGALRLLSFSSCGAGNSGREGAVWQGRLSAWSGKAPAVEGQVSLGLAGHS